MAEVEMLNGAIFTEADVEAMRQELARYSVFATLGAALMELSRIHPDWKGDALGKFFEGALSTLAGEDGEGVDPRRFYSKLRESKGLVVSENVMEALMDHPPLTKDEEEALGLSEGARRVIEDLDKELAMFIPGLEEPGDAEDTAE